MRRIGEGKFAHADLHQLSLRHRRLRADDRSARHGHGHDQGLRQARLLAASAIRPALSAAIGEVLVATASGLIIAIPAFGAFYFLRNRAADVAASTSRTSMNSLFRKMPYEQLAGVASR